MKFGLNPSKMLNDARNVTLQLSSMKDVIILLANTVLTNGVGYAIEYMNMDIMMLIREPLVLENNILMEKFHKKINNN